MAAGFATFTVDMILQVKFGKRFRRNPWGAGTLEWAMPTPPTTYNFASLPKVSDRDPLYAEPALPPTSPPAAAISAGQRTARWRRSASTW
jgi:cytochrome c oxidase subunit I+III